MWYSLKDFSSDIHVLTVLDSPSIKGVEYERPAYPNTWARMEGNGRVWYTSMGRREDVWTNPIFRSVLKGGIQWACVDATGDMTPNLEAVAPEWRVNSRYVEPKLAAPKEAPAPAAAPAQ